MYASTKENIKQDLKNGAQRVKSDVKHDLNGVLDDVKSDLQDASRQAGVYVRELADAASQTMSDATETVTERVTEKPIQSLAIAAGVGFFLGMLFRR